MASNPEIALAIVGSHTTAIAAELVAELEIYPEFLAICRRGATTSLPVALNGDEWGGRLKHPGYLGAGKLIREFLDEITGMTGGRRFDCFIHHSKDPFSQLLSDHPLCRKYFYIEEGFTALTGGTFGRPKKRPMRKLMWNLRSRIFYKGRINRYRNFFDTSAPNYGGAFALSKGAFKGFPNRIQLDARSIKLEVPIPAELVLFLDSQYFIGNCREEDYIAALRSAVMAICVREASVAVKFHPGEKVAERRDRICSALSSLAGVKNLVLLPPSFIGERMSFNPRTKILVGTSAIGLYLGERGFKTYSFAKILAPSSERFAAVCVQLPTEFHEVCKELPSHDEH